MKCEFKRKAGSGIREDPNKGKGLKVNVKRYAAFRIVTFELLHNVCYSFFFFSWKSDCTGIRLKAQKGNRLPCAIKGTPGKLNCVVEFYYFDKVFKSFLF